MITCILPFHISNKIEMSHISTFFPNLRPVSYQSDPSNVADSMLQIAPLRFPSKSTVPLWEIRRGALPSCALSPSSLPSLI